MVLASVVQAANCASTDGQPAGKQGSKPKIKTKTLRTGQDSLPSSDL
jgi:hypothetical protein